ncbi:hypothetical protein FOA52_012505 [Chlamydomonas sp. UWO 241]|nr:hypothetical protein FOA52_012505 [Chlamydomonas sp. UWO 241]
MSDLLLMDPLIPNSASGHLLCVGVFATCVEAAAAHDLAALGLCPPPCITNGPASLYAACDCVAAVARLAHLYPHLIGPAAVAAAGQVAIASGARLDTLPQKVLDNMARLGQELGVHSGAGCGVHHADAGPQARAPSAQAQLPQHGHGHGHGQANGHAPLPLLPLPPPWSSPLMGTKLEGAADAAADAAAAASLAPPAPGTGLPLSMLHLPELEPGGAGPGAHHAAHAEYASEPASPSDASMAAAAAAYGASGPPGASSAGIPGNSNFRASFMAEVNKKMGTSKAGPRAAWAKAGVTVKKPLGRPVKHLKAGINPMPTGRFHIGAELCERLQHVGVADSQEEAQATYDLICIGHCGSGAQTSVPASCYTTLQVQTEIAGLVALEILPEGDVERAWALAREAGCQELPCLQRPETAQQRRKRQKQQQGGVSPDGGSDDGGNQVAGAGLVDSSMQAATAGLLSLAGQTAQQATQLLAALGGPQHAGLAGLVSALPGIPTGLPGMPGLTGIAGDIAINQMQAFGLDMHQLQQMQELLASLPQGSPPSSLHAPDPLWGAALNHASYQQLSHGHTHNQAHHSQGGLAGGMADSGGSGSGAGPSNAIVGSSQAGPSGVTSTGGGQFSGLASGGQFDFRKRRPGRVAAPHAERGSLHHITYGSDGRWKAQLWSRGKMYYSRRFRTAGMAAAAADLLIYKAQGPSAVTNYPLSLHTRSLVDGLTLEQVGRFTLLSDEISDAALSEFLIALEGAMREALAAEAAEAAAGSSQQQQQQPMQMLPPQQQQGQGQLAHAQQQGAAQQLMQLSQAQQPGAPPQAQALAQAQALGQLVAPGYAPGALQAQLGAHGHAQAPAAFAMAPGNAPLGPAAAAQLLPQLQAAGLGAAAAAAAQLPPLGAQQQAQAQQLQPQSPLEQQQPQQPATPLEQEQP